MRVFLTAPELKTDQGQQLLELCLQITDDGKLDLQEIIALRKWLRANSANKSVKAIPYLSDIMKRATADGIIDRDEQLELQLAVERVIPNAKRLAAIEVRKKREAERRDRAREKRLIEKEQEKEELKKLREAERARAMRLRHKFAKVAGVTYPNDDGSERQQIVAKCQKMEPLRFQHDAYNEYSIFATKVLRANGEQLGHAPEYLAERICSELEDGYSVVGIISEVTGGTVDSPTRGVNFATFFVDSSVTETEFSSYVGEVMAKRT